MKDKTFHIIKNSLLDLPFEKHNWEELIYLNSEKERRQHYTNFYLSYIRKQTNLLFNNLASCSCTLCKYPKGTPTLQYLKSLDKDNDDLRDFNTNEYF